MTAAERIEAAGFDDVIILEGYSYDDALIGVTEEGRAVYDYEKMVAWLVRTQGFTEDEAVEWIDFNTINALPNAGPLGPLIMYRV